MCRLLHCTPAQLEDESAVTLDWFMQFRKLELEIQAEQQETG